MTPDEREAAVGRLMVESGWSYEVASRALSVVIVNHRLRLAGAGWIVKPVPDVRKVKLIPFSGQPFAFVMGADLLDGWADDVEAIMAASRAPR